MDRGWAGRAGLPLIGSFFLTGGESNRRASDKGWESERPIAEMGGGREGGGRAGGGVVVVGRWRKRGMKSSEGPESSTAKPKLPSERSAPAAPEPEWPRCPGARPGPARWGPLGPRPPGGGRGRPTWGAAQPRSPEIEEPGSATAAARQWERSAERGGGWRLPSRSPGLRKIANYFSKDSNFPSSSAGCGPSCFGIVFRIPAGAPERDRLPRIPRPRLG